MDDVLVSTGGLTVTFWDSETAGTQHTDLLDEGGNAISSVVTANGTGTRAKGQIPPLRGPNDVTWMWAECDGGPRVLMVTNDAANIIPVLPVVFPPLSQIGNCTVGEGQHRFYNDFGFPLLLTGVRASVGTPPTGTTPIRVDMNRNGTSIFSTQANRPTINAGQSTSGLVTAIDVATLAEEDYITVDVDTVGSTTPGANLSVQVVAVKA
ncbi:hypothetical protein JNW90_10540 [Micromonospora sp. STR1s_5]|nr:hypothetical protein [Micromonospora sp. STR1s_5]